MEEVYSIALDGPSGAGKSTIAKAVAEELNILYLDTGAMYRAMGLYMMDRGVDLADETAIAQELPGADVTVEYAGGAQRTILQGVDVSERIRTPEASTAASAVSRIPAVRQRLVAMQRAIAKGISLIMDGRDIGTHVLPDATLKVFLIASPEVRARRRFDELTKKGMSVTYDEVFRDMAARDNQDSTRAISPLRKADDAVEVNTDTMTIQQVTERVLFLLGEKRRARLNG